MYKSCWKGRICILSYITAGTDSTVKKENKSNVQTCSQLFHLTAELVAVALYFVIRLVLSLSVQACINLFIPSIFIPFTRPFLSSLYLSFLLSFFSFALIMRSCMCRNSCVYLYFFLPSACSNFRISCQTETNCS